MGQARHNMRWEKGNRKIKHERKGWLKRGRKRAEDKNKEQDRVRRTKQGRVGSRDKREKEEREKETRDLVVERTRKECERKI